MERKIETYNDIEISVLKEMSVRINGVFVPLRIGHNYRPFELYTIDHLETIKSHSRMQVFASKGCKCSIPDCDREGYYVIYTRDGKGNVHVDLYTKDFILMTVDHIWPRARGGANTLANKQPMCNRHNLDKSTSTIVYSVATRRHSLVTI